MTSATGPVGKLLDGKVALVTGAGGRGVGAASAHELAARGARVVVNYRRNRQPAQEVVDAIVGAGGGARAIQADVLDAEQIARLVAEILAAYGRLDIVVSSKGGRPPGMGSTGELPGQQVGENATVSEARGTKGHDFKDLTWEELSANLIGDLQAAFNVTKAVVPVMERQHDGRRDRFGPPVLVAPLRPRPTAAMS